MQFLTFVYLLGGVIGLIPLTKGDGEPLILLFLIVPILIILTAEYFAVIRRSQKATLIVAVIYLMGTIFLILAFLFPLFELLATTKPNEASSQEMDFYPTLLILIYSGLIIFGHLRWYLFLDNLKPAVTLGKDELEYIGFGKRFLATMIDAIIFISILYPVNMLVMKYSLVSRTFVPLLFFFLINTAILIFLVVKFGGTPGKLLLRIRIVNRSGKFLTVSSAILRIILSLPNLTILYLKMNSIFATMPATETLQTLKEVGQAFELYGGIYNNRIISAALWLIPLIDVAFILFTKQKRALHDFIAKSFVISKESYLEIKETNTVD